MRTRLIPICAAALAALSALTLAPSAQASFAEFDWLGKWGRGTIVYDRDALDSNPAAGQASFLDSIVSFDVTGWDMMTARRFQGTDGSLFTQLVEPAPGCDPFIDGNCGTARLTFALGDQPGDPAHYQLNIDMPFVVDADGKVPFFESIGGFTGWVSNSLDNTGYGTMDLSMAVSNTPVEQPVPEPSTWALFALGTGMLLSSGRRLKR